MSFFENIQDQGLFSQRASESLQRAVLVLTNIVSTAITPYYDFASHAKSIAHPFMHIAQLSRNLTHLVYETSILVVSIVSLNGNDSAYTLGNMAMITLASALEIVNTVLSIVSFVTRTLASILNFNFTSMHINPQTEPWHDHAGDQQDIDQIINNRRTDLMLAAKDNIAKSTDEIVNNFAFTLV